MDMKNLIFPALATLAIVPATEQAKAAPAQKKADKRPNVLIILADDLGLGDLSCTYSKDMRTPNIDGLFSEGVRLDNYYSNSSLSSPARASLLTGRYCDMVGVQGVIRNEGPYSYYENFGFLSPSAILLPKILKDNGYSTAMFGKWHLGYSSPNLPNDRGFDLFKGFLGGMLDDYYAHTRKGYNALRINKEICPPIEGHITDVLSNWAVDYLKQQENKDKPFFLYLAYNAPHIPLDAPKEWIEMVKKREPGITDTRAKYVALIEHMDAGIGRVLVQLKESGQWDNTFIIFTSDNGGAQVSEPNNGPYRGYKASMYEGGIREPAAFYLKGRIEKGRSSNMAQHMDIVPTICDLLGIRIDHKIDGISILPTLEGKAQNTSDRYFWWMVREANNGGNKLQTAVRYGNYKLLQNLATEPYELFDLSVDPQETKSLPLSGEIYDSLYFHMRVRISSAGAVPWNMPEDKYVSWDECNINVPVSKIK